MHHRCRRQAGASSDQKADRERPDGAGASVAKDHEPESGRRERWERYRGRRGPWRAVGGISIVGGVTATVNSEDEDAMWTGGGAEAVGGVGEP